MAANWVTKFVAISLISIIIIASAAISTLILFPYVGLIITLIVLAIHLVILFVILIIFSARGLRSLTYFEAVMAHGTKLPRQLIIQDPVMGTELFNKTGYIVPAQFGTYFIYGVFPFIKGWNKVRINQLTNKEIAGNPLTILGFPEYKADEIYIETRHKIMIKGGLASYTELKFMETGVDTLSKIGVLVRESIAVNPKNVDKLKDLKLEDLLQSGI